MEDYKYPGKKEIAFKRLRKAVAEYDALWTFEFICSFPDIFRVTGPVKKDGKFTYTVEILDK